MQGRFIARAMYVYSGISADTANHSRNGVILQIGFSYFLITEPREWLDLSGMHDSVAIHALNKSALWQSVFCCNLN